MLELATHTSGLPLETKTQLNDSILDNPFKDFDWLDMQKFLQEESVDSAKKGEYSYSNIGYGLLVLSLANRRGVSYESMIKKGVFEPLNMSNTTTSL